MRARGSTLNLGNRLVHPGCTTIKSGGVEADADQVEKIALREPTVQFREERDGKLD